MAILGEKKKERKQEKGTSWNEMIKNWGDFSRAWITIYLYFVINIFSWKILDLTHSERNLWTLIFDKKEEK